MRAHQREPNALATCLSETEEQKRKKKKMISIWFLRQFRYMFCHWVKLEIMKKLKVYAFRSLLLTLRCLQLFIQNTPKTNASIVNGYAHAGYDHWLHQFVSRPLRSTQSTASAIYLRPKAICDIDVWRMPSIYRGMRDEQKHLSHLLSQIYEKSKFISGRLALMRQQKFMPSFKLVFLFDLNYRAQTALACLLFSTRRIRQRRGISKRSIFNRIIIWLFLATLFSLLCSYWNASQKFSKCAVDCGMTARWTPEEAILPVE